MLNTQQKSQQQPAVGRASNAARFSVATARAATPVKLHRSMTCRPRRRASCTRYLRKHEWASCMYVGVQGKLCQAMKAVPIQTLHCIAGAAAAWRLLEQTQTQTHVGIAR